MCRSAAQAEDSLTQRRSFCDIATGGYAELWCCWGTADVRSVEGTKEPEGRGARRTSARARAALPLCGSSCSILHGHIFVLGLRRDILVLPPLWGCRVVICSSTIYFRTTTCAAAGRSREAKSWCAAAHWAWLRRHILILAALWGCKSVTCSSRCVRADLCNPRHVLAGHWCSPTALLGGFPSVGPSAPAAHECSHQVRQGQAHLRPRGFERSCAVRLCPDVPWVLAWLPQVHPPASPAGVRHCWLRCRFSVHKQTWPANMLAQAWFAWPCTHICVLSASSMHLGTCPCMTLLGR